MEAVYFINGNDFVNREINCENAKSLPERNRPLVTENMN